MYRPIVLACLVLLCSCASHSARVRGLTPLNRNAEGESTPVDIRFFLLRDDTTFASAGFSALWTDPVAVLGPALIGKPTTATVLPGGQSDPATCVRVSEGQAAWVGVQLLVRKEGDLPRTLLIPIDRLERCVIEVTGYGLRLAER